LIGRHVRAARGRLADLYTSSIDADEYVQWLDAVLRRCGRHDLT
jgi:hypothetical protein